MLSRMSLRRRNRMSNLLLIKVEERKSRMRGTRETEGKTATIRLK